MASLAVIITRFLRSCKHYFHNKSHYSSQINKYLTPQANTIIPPPYSCMGSLEDVAQPPSHSATPPSQLPRSASSLTSAGEYQRPHASPSVHSHLSGVATTSSTPSQASGKPEQPSIRNNPFFERQSGAEANRSGSDARSGNAAGRCGSNAGACGNGARCALCGGGGTETRCQQQNCDASPLSTLRKVNRKVASSFVKKEHSQDSESQEEEHNFSDLLNLSVCVTSSHVAAGKELSNLAKLLIDIYFEPSTFVGN